MSQETLKAEITRKALSICNDRIRRHSRVALPGILESTRAQLEWLVAFFEGRNNERQRLRELCFGHYAAREMDERDTEFIDALNRAYYVASRTAAGLKLDMKVLGGDL
ncbi:immunity protein Tsi6 family protein [Stutzerimonas stutzeri]|uniref:immunity protein Tsi6 family protein n=1 Tax=Stutzerimonas stutzeri TaxID=316 RepID=UPI001C2E800A|nr:immunity protein Tsi6 family protein [Stutzerimonas stutzeri]